VGLFSKEKMKKGKYKQQKKEASNNVKSTMVLGLKRLWKDVLSVSAILLLCPHAAV